MSQEVRNQITIVDNGNGDEPQISYTDNRPFASVLEARLARRSLLKGSAGAAALGFMSLGLAGCLSSSDSSDDDRSEERRVGKGWRGRWGRDAYRRNVGCVE